MVAYRLRNHTNLVHQRQNSHPIRLNTMGAEGSSPLIVGKIIAPYGVKGWLKVFSYTRPVEQILQYSHWMLATQPDSSEWQVVQVTSTAQRTKKLIAKLPEVDDLNSSQRLAGNWIAIQATQLAQLPHGEYYWNDLLGLSVVNQDGIQLGSVDHIVETGANDVLVVRYGEQSTASDAVERLLPWSPHVIIDVDVAASCLRVDWHPDD